MNDRAQTFTLEAIVAALLLVAAIAFALQAVAISANTASVADTELQGQHIGLAQGALDGSIERGELHQTILYWDGDAERFYNTTDEQFYIDRAPPTQFGESFSTALQGSGLRYNIDLQYQQQTGERDSQRLVESGTPTADAVRVTQTVTLFDDDELADKHNETAGTGTTLANASSTFYVPNVDDSSPVYNVIRVEVVLWQG